MDNIIDLFDEVADEPKPFYRQIRHNPTTGKRTVESAPAFAAFKAYCLAGTSRSLRLVARTLGKSQQLLSRWSVVHSWQERTRAFDNMVADRENEAFIKERQAMARRQANVAVIGQNAATRALVELDAAIAAGTVKLKPMEIAKLLCDTAKLERTNRGEPDNDQVASIVVEIRPQAQPRFMTVTSEDSDKFDA
jgi:hypothetical protein